MGEYILKVLTDILFYLAIFMPIIKASPLAIQIALAVVPAAWAVWVKMNWKKRNFMDAIRNHFSLQTRLLVVSIPLELFIFGLESWTKINAPLVVAFAAVGILALKTGRIADGNQGKGIFWFVSGLELAAVLLIVFVVSSDQFVGGILSLLGNGYKMLILPIVLFLLQGMISILELVWPYVMAIFSRHEVKFQADESFTITSGELDMDLKQAERVAGAEVIRAFGILLAIALVVLFIWYLYRRFSRVSAERERRMMGTISHSSLAPQEIDREKQSLFGGERNVRYYYRKFMMLCKKQGGWKRGSVTTEHVHEAAKEYWSDEESLSTLRHMYLDVRYGGYEDSAADKKQAKEIYRKLKNQLKEEK